MKYSKFGSNMIFSLFELLILVHLSSLELQDMADVRNLSNQCHNFTFKETKCHCEEFVAPATIHNSNKCYGESQKNSAHLSPSLI